MELQTAVTAHRAGNFEEAENIYRLLIEKEPGNFVAQHNLGMLVLSLRGPFSAMPYLKKALELNPSINDFWIDYAEALTQAGWLDAAVTLIRQGENHVQDHVPFAALKQRIQALSHSQTKPKQADTSQLLQAFAAANYLEAEAIARYITQCEPEKGYGWKLLGSTCAAVGRIDESIPYLKQAATFLPEDYEVLSNLAAALHGVGRSREAEHYCRQALMLKPAFSEAHSNLGNILRAQGRHSEAVISHRRAIELRPDFAEAHNNLALVLQSIGEIEEAEAEYRKALALKPTLRNTHSNLLFCCNYSPTKTAEAIFAEYQRYNQSFGIPKKREWGPHRNDQSLNRRLRIGYMSADWDKHPVRHFIQPIIERHDRSQFEVFIYAETTVEDVFTKRYKAHCDHWFVTKGLDAAKVAKKIKEDQIDILVDLAGHTEGNRLDVFALKPAPVSISYLGYGYTSGLSAIDYFIGDDDFTPKGCEPLFAEKLWRLDKTYVYRPDAEMGEVSELPAVKNGYITFVTLTRAIRINPLSTRTWSGILNAIPSSRLIINSRDFIDPIIANKLAENFQALGIARERLEIGYRSPPWDILRAADIALDCFPHNSGTTLFESLYMGLPFITLAGRPSVGRLGASILHGIKHPEWIASSEQEYVEKAVQLASDLPHLVALRHRLRCEMKNSELMSESSFTRKLETAYREMWAIWVTQSQTTTQTAENQTYSISCDPEDRVTECLRTVREKHLIGRIKEAEALLQPLLALHPTNPELNHEYGTVALDQKRPAAAIHYLKAALESSPDSGRYWLAYITALIKLARIEDAQKTIDFVRAKGLKHDAIEEIVQKIATLPWLSREIQQIAPHQLSTATKSTTRVKVHKLLAKIVDKYRCGKVKDALQEADALVRRYPDDALTWKALGVLHCETKNFTKAIEVIQRAILLNPKDKENFNNLGVAYLESGLLEDAELCFRRAVYLDHQYVDAYFNLGNCLRDMEFAEAAETSYRYALNLQPNHAAGHNNLGALLLDLGKLAEAVEHFQLALQKGLSRSLALSQLSLVQAYLSDYTNVKSLSDEAVDLSPEDSTIWAQRLYALSYHPDLPDSEIYNEFCRWGDLQYRKFKPASGGQFENSRSPHRKLRVGFISPDFRRHTSRFYFSALFENYDESEIELIAYANVLNADDWTINFKGWVDEWRDIRYLSDLDVANLIRQDRIDILIDGCNHMRDHRLGVMALKPAPIQVTWLGSAWTSGLPTIDYALFDPYLAPAGTLARETIVHLPKCFVAYRPPEDVPTVAPLPASKNGFVTFGYSGRTERLNHKTFTAWARILEGTPNSRLILDYKPFGDDATRNYYLRYMARCGMDVNRVLMRNSANIFESLSEIDILLDCFPHSGGTMLFDALWMGVPALTLASRPPVGRIGTSLMMNLGLPEWVTHDEEEYIARAIKVSGDLAQLADLRAQMRARMRNSPLMDEKGFAAAYISALRNMWKTWCEVKN